MKQAIHFGKLIFAIMRIPVYLILFWLRLPVIWVCSSLSFLFLFAWLFSLYAFPDKKEMVWGFGLISLGAFIVSWVYDWMLMIVAPHDIEIIR